MKIGRAWPAVILALFCLPLFLGLGNGDLYGDEAIYSWGVDGILEHGNWLIPKSSPYPDRPFLEKPPLKFWIVAGGIKAGLPHDEFGLRFWDALFGGAAFLYVYAIGRRLGGPACGSVAALILFIHQPLVFDHGLRSNNMEAPLVLCYCGGVFHYLKWSSSESRRARWLHAIGVALYFTLGFMVKFVAAIFLPLILGASGLIVRGERTKLLRDSRIWIGAGLVAFALIAPWFVYCTVVFGYKFWTDIFGAHIYTRFTSSLDPAHVHPWNHYFVELGNALRKSQALSIVAIGAVLFVADTIRRRRGDGLLIVLWFALPLGLISLGTSKLYHYAYPFVPPVALAGGFLASFLWEQVRPPAERALTSVFHFFSRPADRISRPLAIAQRVCLVLAAVALIVAVWTLLNGSLVIRGHGTILFQNRQMFRPVTAAVVLVILGGWPRGVARMGILLVILAILPVAAYHATFTRLTEETHLLRPVRDCVLRVGARPELMTDGPRGMYVDGDGPRYESPFNHQYAYYFSHVNPWKRQRATPPSLLARYLFDPSEQRPVLIGDLAYQAFVQRTLTTGQALPNRVVLEPDVLLVLPGPYEACFSDIAASQRTVR